MTATLEQALAGPLTGARTMWQRNGDAALQTVVGVRGGQSGATKRDVIHEQTGEAAADSATDHTFPTVYRPVPRPWGCADSAASNSAHQFGDFRPLGHFCQSLLSLFGAHPGSRHPTFPLTISLEEASIISPVQGSCLRPSKKVI